MIPFTNTTRRPRRKSRRGSATVELALTLPFLLTLVFGVIEVGRALEVSQLLTMAVREGGRFGATDKQGYIPDGMTANEKIVGDVRTILNACGISSGELDIECVTVPETEGETPVDFDFEDVNNHLKLFRVNARIPFSAVTYCPPPLQKFLLPTQQITAGATFRNYQK